MAPRDSVTPTSPIRGRHTPSCPELQLLMTHNCLFFPLGSVIANQKLLSHPQDHIVFLEAAYICYWLMWRTQRNIRLLSGDWIMLQPPWQLCPITVQYSAASPFTQSDFCLCTHRCCPPDHAPLNFLHVEFTPSLFPWELEL